MLLMFKDARDFDWSFGLFVVLRSLRERVHAHTHTHTHTHTHSNQHVVYIFYSLLAVVLRFATGAYSRQRSEQQHSGTSANNRGGGGGGGQQYNSQLTETGFPFSSNRLSRDLRLPNSECCFAVSVAKELDESSAAAAWVCIFVGLNQGASTLCVAIFCFSGNPYLR